MIPALYRNFLTAKVVYLPVDSPQRRQAFEVLLSPPVHILGATYPYDTQRYIFVTEQAKKLSKVIAKEWDKADYNDKKQLLNELLKFHKEHGKMITMTAVRPSARFGELDIYNDNVVSFKEKPQLHSGWINGGFFVFEPEVIDYIKANDEPLETGALPRLVSESQLMAFEHGDFWQPMDTLREKHILEDMIKSNNLQWLNLNK